MNQSRALAVALVLVVACAEEVPLPATSSDAASSVGSGGPTRGGGDPASGAGQGGASGSGANGGSARGGSSGATGGAAGGGTIGSGGAGAVGATGGAGGGAGSSDAALGPCATNACQGQPVPAIGCASGSPRFECVRAIDGVCRWGPPTCPPPSPADAGRADAGIGGGPCTSDSDCHLFEDYCTGCDCRSLAKTDPDPKCAGPGVRCFAAACLNKVAACVNGRCGLKDKPAAALKWFRTCGDPVCRGYTGGSGAPKCTTEKAGDACATAETKCDPGDNCNALLVCGTMGPQTCPISRRDAKQDIRYLPSEALGKLRDELLAVPLATWRYKDDPSAAHLGFIIEDLRSSSPAVDAQRGFVDLYGYTSMAVATIQLQAREIASLRTEVEQLKRQVRGRRSR